MGLLFFQRLLTDCLDQARIGNTLYRVKVITFLHITIFGELVVFLYWRLGFLSVKWVFYGGYIFYRRRGPLEQQVFLDGYVFCLAGYLWDGFVGAIDGTDN